MRAPNLEFPGVPDPREGQGGFEVRKAPHSGAFSHYGHHPSRSYPGLFGSDSGPKLLTLGSHHPYVRGDHCLPSGFV